MVQERIGKCSILAPIDGTVQEVRQPGINYLRPIATLSTSLRLSRLMRREEDPQTEQWA